VAIQSRQPRLSEREPIPEDHGLVAVHVGGMARALDWTSTGNAYGDMAGVAMRVSCQPGWWSRASRQTG
jgi:hypothetical protein